MKKGLTKSQSMSVSSATGGGPTKRTQAPIPRRSYSVCHICNKPRPLMTVEDVAEYLNLTSRCMYELVARAKSRVNPPSNPIPFRKIGSGRLRFDFDEIVEWTKRGDENAD